MTSEEFEVYFRQYPCRNYSPKSCHRCRKRPWCMLFRAYLLPEPVKGNTRKR